MKFQKSSGDKNVILGIFRFRWSGDSRDLNFPFFGVSKFAVFGIYLLLAVFWHLSVRRCFSARICALFRILSRPGGGTLGEVFVCMLSIVRNRFLLQSERVPDCLSGRGGGGYSILSFPRFVHLGNNSVCLSRFVMLSRRIDKLGEHGRMGWSGHLDEQRYSERTQVAIRYLHALISVFVLSGSTRVHQLAIFLRNILLMTEEDTLVQITAPVPCLQKLVIQVICRSNATHYQCRSLKIVFMFYTRF